MYKRLLGVIVLGVLLLSACAKPPVAKLEETRSIVAHAYASGAALLAGEVYQLASDALEKAEEHARKGRYQDAERELELARNYSNKALNLTIQKKKQIEEVKLRDAEKERKAAEMAREEKLRQLREEQARKERAEKQAKSAATADDPPELQLVDKVTAQPGENLQMIAEKPEVYNDGKLWPLIYKANRDQIKDPKEIFPGQEFLVPRDKSEDEVAAARKEAEELNLF